MIAARSMIEAALRRLRSLPQPAFTFRCPHSRTRTTIRDQLVSHDRRDHACRINGDPTNRANALLQPPRCLRSSAFFDADFRSQPKAFSFRCRRLRPASFDACLHHRRLQSALLSLLTCHRRLGTSRAPASFNADARRHSCHPPPCASCDAPFIGQPRCLNRSASLDAHDPSALPCSRSRTFSCVRLSDLDRAHLSTLTITTSCAVHTFTHVFRSRLAPLPNTLTARVHIQRFVIEKVWLFRLRKNHPARAFEPSNQSFVVRNC